MAKRGVKYIILSIKLLAKLLGIGDFSPEYDEAKVIGS